MHAIGASWPLTVDFATRCASQCIRFLSQGASQVKNICLWKKANQSYVVHSHNSVKPCSIDCESLFTACQVPLKSGSSRRTFAVLRDLTRMDYMCWKNGSFKHEMRVLAQLWTFPKQMRCVLLKVSNWCPKLFLDLHITSQPQHVSFSEWFQYPHICLWYS
jgi:hypothetical protein